VSKTWRREPDSDSGGKKRGGSKQSTTQWRHLYASHRWRVASENFRTWPEHALCADCLAAGEIVPSKVVDHIEPHNGDLVKFWDETNWRALCIACHSAKTLDDQYEERTGKKRPRKGFDVNGEPLDRNHHWWK
jgi:5-methylcytosine-specific restriction endonuclease McrA